MGLVSYSGNRAAALLCIGLIFCAARGYAQESSGEPSPAASPESAASPAVSSPSAGVANLSASTIKPGDKITKDNADKVKDLVSPGVLMMAQQGMEMDIVPSSKLEWPVPYTQATEKYQAQVGLKPDGSIDNYVAGLPFPLVDANDPKVAEKIIWNFNFRPLYTDDMDLRFPEVATLTSTSHGEPIGYFTVGHFAFYNNIGRIEVNPYPVDPDFKQGGVRSKFGFYPFLEPSSLRGYGMVRYRYMDPHKEDNVWVFNPMSRRLRREGASELSDAIAALPGFGGGGGGGMGGGAAGAGGASPFTDTVDPDSYFGFNAKPEDFTYKFLGEKTMLAAVHAKNSPERICTDGRTVCPEDWELRRLYVVQADAKPGKDLSINRRILYIDAEGWFITAEDQFDRQGKLWKVLATFHTYRDRPVPDARVAIYPYKRIFQLAMVDEDITTGTSSIIFMPGPKSPERECWYIDMGVVDSNFFSPQQLGNHAQ